MKKRLLSLILAAVMLFSLLPTAAFAAEQDALPTDDVPLTDDASLMGASLQAAQPSAWVEGYADGSKSNFRASQMLVVKTSGFAPEANLKYHYYSTTPDRGYEVFSWGLLCGWPMIKQAYPPPEPKGGFFGAIVNVAESLVTAVANFAGILYAEDAESSCPFFAVEGHDSTGMTVRIVVTDTNEGSSTYNKSVELNVGGFAKSNLTKDICVPHAMFVGDNSHVLYLLATSGIGHIYPECDSCATINSLKLSNVSGNAISWSGDTYDRTFIKAENPGVAKMDLSLTKASTCTFHSGTSGAGTSYIKVFQKPTVTAILDGFDLTNMEKDVTYTIGGQSKKCTADGQKLEYRGLAPSCEYEIECSYKLPDNKTAKASVTATTLAPYRINFSYTKLDNLTAAPANQQAKRNNTEKATKPAGPYAPGYVLTGWYADYDFKTPFNFDAPITDNTIIYGKWEKLKYTVKLNLTLDGAAYSGRKVELWQDGKVKYTLASKGNGLYQLDDAVATGKYDVYVDGNSCYKKMNVIGTRTAKDLTAAQLSALIAGETVTDAVSMISLRTSCTVDGVPGNVVQLFYRDAYGQKFVAAYNTNSYVVPASVTDPREFDIFANNVNSGGTISVASPNTTLEFYNMTLNAKIADSTWSCNDVVLRDASGYYIGAMQPQPYANGTKPYTYLMQKDTSATPKEYYVYVNGTNTQLKLTATQDGHIATADMYAPKFTVKKDNAAWKDAALTLTNGDYSYTLFSDAYGVCQPGLIYTTGAEKAYTYSVGGTVDSSASTVTSSGSKTVALDYYTVKYFTYYNKGSEEAPSYAVNTTPYREQIVKKSQQAAQVAAPYVAGLSFNCFGTAGWTLGEASVTPYNFASGVTSALSLYAHFEKPTVKFNGYVRTGSNGAADASGGYFTLANLTISGFDEGAAIKSIVVNTTNAKVTAANPTGGTADNTNTNNPVITFTNKVTMEAAQTYLRGLVFQPIDSALDAAVSLTVSDGVANTTGRTKITAAEATTDITWTKITSGSTNGKTLNSGYYYVANDVSFTNGTAGGSGLTINGDVKLYIPKDVTVTATGANGSGQTGGGAGIELPSGKKLYLYGEGTLIATGGNAGSGALGSDGEKGSISSIGKDHVTYSVKSGKGGAGGGGAGAGIGTKGGAGGDGGTALNVSYNGGYNVGAGLVSLILAKDGTKGNAGTAGTQADDAGTVYKNGSVTVSATKGGAGMPVEGESSPGEVVHETFKESIYSARVYVGKAGGGGNGAPGRAGNDIGPGGSGGGGGGSGAAGATNKSDSVSDGGRGGHGDETGKTGESYYVPGLLINDEYVWVYSGDGGDGGKTPANKSGSSVQSCDALPTYTVTFNGGTKPTTSSVNYTWTSTTNQINVPNYTPAAGQFFLGWQVSTYAKNVNGSAATKPLTTAETTLYQPGAVIKPAQFTYGDIELKPVTMGIAGKTAIEKLGGVTLPTTAQTQYTYTVTTKLNNTQQDVGNITLISGSTEYTIGGGNNGSYKLTTTDNKTFTVYLDGESTGVTVAANGTATVNVLSYTVTTKLDGTASAAMGDVTLKNGSTILSAEAVMSNGQPTGTYQLRKLPIDTITANTEFEIYVGGKSTGIKMKAGNAATVDYYTAKVTINGNAPINSVVLKNVAGDVTLTKTSTGVFTGTHQTSDASYAVCVNGNDSGKTVKFAGTGNSVTGNTLNLTIRVNGTASDATGYVPTYKGAPMSYLSAGTYYAVEFGTAGTAAVDGTEKGFTNNACVFDYYTVTYNANCSDSTGSVPTDSVYYLTGSTPEVLAAGTLARANYQLQGWKLSGDTVYKAGDKLPAISTAVSLKAIWKSDAEYPIVVISGGEVIYLDPEDLGREFVDRNYPSEENPDGTPGMTIIISCEPSDPFAPVYLPGGGIHLGPNDKLQIKPGVDVVIEDKLINEGEIEILSDDDDGDGGLTTGEFINKGTMKNDGELTVEEGSNEEGGIFVNGGKFTIEGTTDPKTESGSFENKGNFENKKDGEITVNSPNGGMENAEGANMENEGELTVNGKFKNDGYIDNTGKIGSDNPNNAEFENNSTINSSGGSIDTPIDNENGAVVGGEVGGNGKITGGTAVGMDTGDNPDAVSGAMNAPGGTVNDPAPGGNLPENSPTPTQAQLDAIFGKGSTVLATGEDGELLLDENGGYIVILIKGVQLANPVVIPNGVKATIELAGKELTGPDGKPAVTVAGGTVVIEDVIGGGSVNGGKGTGDGGSGGPGIQVTSGNLKVAEIPITDKDGQPVLDEEGNPVERAATVNGGPGVGSGSGGSGVDVTLEEGKTCGVEIEGNVTGGAGGASPDGTAGNGGNGIKVDLPEELPEGMPKEIVKVTGEISGGAGGTTLDGVSGGGGGAVTIASAPEDAVKFDEKKAKGGDAGDVVDEENGKKGVDSQVLTTDIPQGGKLPVGGLDYENPGPGKLNFNIIESKNSEGVTFQKNVVLTGGNIDMPQNGEVSADGTRVKNTTGDDDTQVRVTLNEEGGANITVPAPADGTPDPEKTVTVKGGGGAEGTGIAEGGVDVLPVGENGEIVLKPDRAGVEVIVPKAATADVLLTDGGNDNAPDVIVKGGSTGGVSVTKTETGFDTEVTNGSGETSTVITGGTEYLIPEGTTTKLTAADGATPATITEGAVKLGTDKGPDSGGAGVVIPTEQPYTVSNATGTGTGVITVTKTATGASIAVPGGSSFAIDKENGEKEVYTAEGTLTSVYVSDGSGNVKLGSQVVEGESGGSETVETGVALKLDTGTVTLNDGQSVYANTPASGDKGKLIFNPTNTLNDSIVADAGNGTVDTAITLAKDQIIGLGGVLKNGSITGASRYTAAEGGAVLALDKTSSVFDDGTTLLQSGAIELDAEDEKLGITGATAKYFIDVPADKPTVTVAAANSGTCDITIPANGEADITVGGKTYRCINSYSDSVTFSVSADGMSVTAGGTAYTMTADSDTTLTFKAYAGTGSGVTSPVTTLTAGAVMLDTNESIYETNGKTVIKNTNTAAVKVTAAVTEGETDTLVPLPKSGSVEIDGILYENVDTKDLQFTIREVDNEEKIILTDGAVEMATGGKLTVDGVTMTNASTGDAAQKDIRITKTTTGADIEVPDGASLNVRSENGGEETYTADGTFAFAYVTDGTGNVKLADGESGGSQSGSKLTLTDGYVILTAGQTVYTDTGRVIQNSNTGDDNIVAKVAGNCDTEISVPNGKDVTIGSGMLNGEVQNPTAYTTAAEGTVLTLDKSNANYTDGTTLLKSGAILLDAADAPIGVVGATKEYYIDSITGTATVAKGDTAGTCNITVPVNGEVDITVKGSPDKVYQYINHSASPVTVSITASGTIKTVLNDNAAPDDLPTGEKFEGYCMSVNGDTTQFIFEDNLDKLLSKDYLDSVSGSDENKYNKDKTVRNTVVVNTAKNPVTEGYVLTQNCIDVYTAQGNLAKNHALRDTVDTAYGSNGWFTVDSRERSQKYLGNQSIADNVTGCMVVKVSNETGEPGHVEIQSGEAKIRWSETDTTYYVTLEDAIYDASHNVDEGGNQYNTHDGKNGTQTVGEGDEAHDEIVYNDQTIEMNINPYQTRENLVLEAGDTLIIRGENNAYAGDTYVGVKDASGEDIPADLTFFMASGKNDVYVVSGTMKVTNNTDSAKGETNGFADGYVGAPGYTGGAYDNDKCYYAKTTDETDVLYVTSGTTADGRADGAAYVTAARDAQSVEIGVGAGYVTYTGVTEGDTFPITAIGKLDVDGEKVTVADGKITADYAVYSVLDEDGSAAKIVVDKDNAKSSAVSVENDSANAQTFVDLAKSGQTVSVDPMGGENTTEYTAAKDDTRITVEPYTGTDESATEYVATLDTGKVLLDNGEAIYEANADVKIENKAAQPITVETAMVNGTVGYIVTVPESGNFDVSDKDGNKTGLNGITVKEETKFFVDETGHITLLDGKVELAGNSDSFINLGTNDEKITGVDGTLTVEAVRTNGEGSTDTEKLENGVTTGYVTVPAGKQATFDNGKRDRQTYLNPTRKPNGTGNDLTDTIIAVLPTEDAQRVVVSGDVELDQGEKIYVTDAACVKATDSAVNTPVADDITLVTDTGSTKIQVSYGNTDTLNLYSPDPFNTVTIPEGGKATFGTGTTAHKVSVADDGNDLDNTMLEAAVFEVGTAPVSEKEITVSFPPLDSYYRAISVDNSPITYTNKDTAAPTLLAITQDGTVYAKKGSTGTAEGDILLDPGENVNIRLESGFAKVENTAKEDNKKIAVGKETEGKNPVTVPKGGEVKIEGVTLNTEEVSGNTIFDVVKASGDVLTGIPADETLKIDGRKYTAKSDAEIRIIPKEKHSGMTEDEVIILSGTLKIDRNEPVTVQELPVVHKEPGMTIEVTDNTVFIPATKTVAINGIAITPTQDNTTTIATGTPATITLPVPAGESVTVDGIVYTNNSGSEANLVINATTGLPTDSTVFDNFDVNVPHGLKGETTVTLPNGTTVERKAQTFTVPAGKSITIGDRTYTAVDGSITVEANGRKADPIVTVSAKVTVTELKQLSKNPGDAEEKAENTYTATGTAKAVFTGNRDDVAVSEGTLELTASNVYHTVKITGKDNQTVVWNTAFSDDRLLGGDDPTKDGYTFDGYYTDSAFTRSLNKNDKVLDDTTVYVKWVKTVENTVSGMVNNDAAEPAAVENATVQLMKGNVEFAHTTTDASGNFSFSNVPEGTYQIVVKDNGSVTTALAAVDKAGHVAINGETTAETASMTLNNSTGTKVSSVVEVKANTPAVIVGGMEAAAEAKKETNKVVEVKLTVESTDTTNSADQAAIKDEAGSKTMEFYDVTLTKTVDSTTTDIGDQNDTLLTILVPFQTSGRTSFIVYRWHDANGNNTVDEGEIDSLTTTANSDGEYIETGSNQVTIYAKKFSTYAIGYSTYSTGGGGGSSSSKYAITGANTENGKLTISPESAAAGKTVTVTVTPDEGYVLDTLTIRDKDGKELELAKLSGTKYTFKMPDGKVSVSATFTEVKTVCPQDETCVYAKFTDADTTAWYHDGVHYCVENGLMKGVSDVLFAPDGTTTRAMIVTMLWRMEGEPVANYAMSFKDVPANEWYTEAIRWAQSNKIVEGYSAEAFCPDGPITREQMATILYRFAKNHEIDTANDNTLAGFTDADKVSDWALDAMKWANAIGLVQGRTTTTLVPEVSIKRCEAATMIQRYCEKVCED